jgi:hypothetical protein
MISHRLPSSGSTWALPILKLQPGSQVEVVIASSRVLYCGVHWLGRELLCSGEDCAACERGISKVRGFAIAMVTQGHACRPVLLEASAGAFSRLEGLVAMDGMSLEPGLVVELSRRRKNSPLRMEPVRSGGGFEVQFKPAWRLAAALAVLFKLSMPSSEESVEVWVERVRPQAAAQLLAALSAS